MHQEERLAHLEEKLDRLLNGNMYAINFLQLGSYPLSAD